MLTKIAICRLKSKAVTGALIVISCYKVSAALSSALPLYVHLTPYIIPLYSDNEITLNVSSEGGETLFLTVTHIPPVHCPGSKIILPVSKEKYVLFTGNFRWQVGHMNRINHLFDNLQEAAVHNFDNIYIDTPFCKKKIPISYLVGRAFFQPSFKPCPWLCSFQNKVVHYCNKTRYGYEFLMKEIALRFNTKVHVSLCQYQLYKFVPSIQNWLTLDSKSIKIHFCKPSSASASLKLLCKPATQVQKCLQSFQLQCFSLKTR